MGTDMTIAQAQADVREVYSGGFGGPAVAAVVWLTAGVVASTVGVPVGAAVLFLGGAVLIFPANLLLNRLLTGRPDLPAGHPMRGLAIQSAATMAVMLLALWLLAPHLPAAFFPLAMIAVGSHYFPFAHLYGDNAFLVAGAIQSAAGLLLLMMGLGDVAAYAMAVLLAALSITLAVRRRGDHT
ncbi:DUF7010 family protein [Ornithinimicrobium pratense]|uniref:Uncharacterized protein n=1 Tax=Ornithinimicrobium pratense TaxID=2593973 RepID=A0A5J6V316_9MICO|nr:hypothetical protein [Ornithinimicrobium pratense]QFG68088.1 hypothetical protein FY030_04590 [Ornithinimicrobium pratense]